MDSSSARPPDFTALILAGGHSKRMGSDKALLQKYLGGPTLIEQVVGALQATKPAEVLLVTNRPHAYGFLNLPTVPDAVEGAGPLGGIVGGMRAGSGELFVVVACDMPSINADFLRYMVSQANDFEAVVPRWTDSDGYERLEPLHAVYARHALPTLEACLAAREFALHRCLPRLNVRYLGESEITPFAPPASLFRNMNRPGEWESWSGRG